MLAHLAYRRYGLAAGVQRIRSSLEKRFDRALHAAIQREEIVVVEPDGQWNAHELVVRAPETPAVRVPGLGDRKFADVSPSEVAGLMRRIREEMGVRDEENLFRLVGTCYGLAKLRASTRATMEDIVMQSRVLAE